MAQIDMSSGSASAYGAGELQLQNKAPMDGTLRIVTDSANTASPLLLSTSLVQTTSTLKITTSDVAYIDAEDNSGNNRFTVSRAVASQLVTVDFASLPTALTTPVGAIRTATDGVSLANVMTFLENGNIGLGTDSPASKLDVYGSLGANTSFIRSTNIDTNDYATFGSGIPGVSNSGTTFTVNGTARMVIGSAGNVGIGTTTPADKLDVAGASGVAVRVSSSSAPAIYNAFVMNLNDFSTMQLVCLGTAIVQAGNVGDTILDSRTTNTIFKTSGVERGRWTSSGLTFNGDTAAANALNDYEEGTWTMGVSFGSASVGVTTSSNTGTYTKIGRQVTVNGYCVLTSKGSSTGAARITGLPFTSANTNGNYCASSFWFDAITFTNQFQGYGNINDTTIDLREITSLGVEGALTDVDFANNSRFMVGLTYFV